MQVREKSHQGNRYIIYQTYKKHHKESITRLLVQPSCSSGGVNASRLQQELHALIFVFVLLTKATTVEPPLMDTPYDRQPLFNGHCMCSNYLVQIDLYIKDTSLLRTLTLVPKCLLKFNRGSTV